MAYTTQKNTFNHWLKGVLGRVEYKFNPLRYPTNEILVVNYHGTPKKTIANFEQHLDLFEKHFQLIGPEEITAFYSEGKTNLRPSLLLTFDDGLKNNLNAVAELNKRGIKAWFFVIPQFIDIPPAEHRTYFTEHIRPEFDQKLFSEEEDLSPMQWEELAQLLKEGHHIGSHSYTHDLKANGSDLNLQKKEIVQSKIRIAEGCKTNIDSISGFCCPNDARYSTGSKEMALIKSNYTFFFGTYPGSNIDRKAYHVKRANIESDWGSGQVIWALNQLNRNRWKKAITRFETEVFDH